MHCSKYCQNIPTTSTQTVKGLYLRNGSCEGKGECKSNEIQVTVH